MNVACMSAVDGTPGLRRGISGVDALALVVGSMIGSGIFLVSADYDMATTYIIHRVLNGDYGVAIAYSSVLIVLMLGAIGLIQLLVGERKLRRAATAHAPLPTGPIPA